jgi:hypothetical protein
MTETVKPEPKQQKQPDRTPIKIKRLLFKADKPTMHGIRVPGGPDGKGEDYRHDLLAGVSGSDKIEIDFRPWLRSFRIARYRKQTRTAIGKDGKGYEAEDWLPAGEPFYVPESWAVWVPVEDA